MTVISDDLPGYLERDEQARGTTRVLFRSGRFIQSGEFNDLQQVVENHIEGIGNALLKDGDRISGCEATVDSATGATNIEAGKIYIAGQVMPVAARSFTVPINRTVSIGVRRVESIITEDEDPTLKNQAEGTRGYNEPGAARLVSHISWGFDEDGGEGEFYGVYVCENGVLLAKSAPPELDTVRRQIADYDQRSTGGFYVTNGMGVTATYDSASESLVTLVAEGSAQVRGFSVELPMSVRQTYVADPDLRVVLGEPHIFTSGTMRVDLNATPVKHIDRVTYEKRVTQTVTHGAVSGSLDQLENSPVLRLVSITQGGVTFTAGVDHQLTDDQVDWSLSGAEPAPGSSYSVTYDYVSTAATITGQDDTGFSLSGVLSGSTFTVDYRYAMQRIDSLVLDEEGRITRIKGVSSRYNPAAPSIPASVLKIASLLHNWSGNPTIINDQVVMVPMGQLQAYQSLTLDLFDLVAQLELKNSIAVNEPTSKRGVFVDPFVDDNLRDAGIEQDCSVANGELVLSIDPTVTQIGTSINTPQLLEYVLETVVSQTLKTESMKINPYQAFDPLPGTMSVVPPIDQWTAVETTWLTPITQRFLNGVQFQNGGGGEVLTSRSTASQLVSRSKAPAEQLRQIYIRANVTGFGAGEVLQSVTFDGITVTPEAV